MRLHSLWLPDLQALRLGVGGGRVGVASRVANAAFAGCTALGNRKPGFKLERRSTGHAQASVVEAVSEPRLRLAFETWVMFCSRLALQS
jgi:hypothetical protein